MRDHGAREHAQWSASATERNWNCPGAIALTDDLPDTTSEAADWGTCCHQLAEHSLRTGDHPVTQLGTVQKGKKFEFEVDEEMVETAWTYVDFVRKQLAEAGEDATLHIEQRFSLESLDPPFGAGGTADAVVYAPNRKHLQVIDLKGGRGHVVEAIGNPQLRTYALGAVLANPDLRVDTIEVVIVQPRAPHKSGRIRSETFHIADLSEWTADLVAAMKRSAMAMAVREETAAGTWASSYLNPGDHCHFCKARGFCPALSQKAMDAVGIWFDDLDQPRITNQPDQLSPEVLAQRLDMLDMIEGWCNAVRAYAHSQAESGVEIPGYQLVEKIGNRAWNAPEEQIVGALVLAGVEEDRIYTRKLVTPAQAEKALGAKKKDVIEGLFERPVRGSNLVAADKSTRPAVPAAVNKHFNVLG